MEYFTIQLQGSINSNNSREYEDYIQNQIDNNEGKMPVFDFSQIDYISSSGLRIFLKLQKSYNEKIKIKNVSLEVYEIFNVTGFTEILDIEKRMREISVDGCKIIGKGYYGTVYRIDDDTIVKVYKIKDSIPMIKNETEKARIALISGIQTAISYDIVKVGDLYGSMFELLDAKTLNEVLVNDPNKIDEVMNLYVSFIKSVHETIVHNNKLPQTKEIYLNYLIRSKNVYTDEQYTKLYNLIDTLPEDNHLVHGDIHMKNIMLVDGEPTLIDMDTLSLGQDVFDNACVYLSYKQYKEDDPNNAQSFFGITNEMSDYVWDKFIELYYSPKSEEEYKKITNILFVIASVQFLFLIETSDDKDDELSKIRKSKTISKLNEILPNVDSLII